MIVDISRYGKQIIDKFEVRDIRFPTSLNAVGSDAVHKDPDYSLAYVIITTDADNSGHGFTFTCGRGTEIIAAGIRLLYTLLKGKSLGEVYGDFSEIWKQLCNESQLRWLGPEKGVMHLAVAAIVNALWDLWAKLENKPLWKLLVDMTPEQIVSTIDFRYITDLLTKDEAIQILKSGGANSEREKEIRRDGYPAYTTAVGWLGFDDQRVRSLCRQFLATGFTAFKMKVGGSLEDDKRRLRICREEIGYDNVMMVDANQIWDVSQAISWMKELSEFKPLWIEEPTSPDDILGYKKISKALEPYGIGVAGGEHGQNRVIFKQMLELGALQYCQIDGCRVGGVNENLAIILMAAKMNVPVCPHAGGVGLCEVVQHFSFWDYISVSKSLDQRWTEYIQQLSEHFVDPCKATGSKYVCPSKPGFSTEMKRDSIEKYSYPDGPIWQNLFKEGKFPKPSPVL